MSLRTLSLFLVLSAFFLGACSSGKTYRIAPTYTKLNHSLTGTWDSDWGEITLKQSGTHVTGTYTRFNGTKGQIIGALEGNLLRFSWLEKGDLTSGRMTRRGQAFWNLSRDGKELKGRWGYDRSRVNGGTWDARRSQKYED